MRLPGLYVCWERMRRVHLRCRFIRAGDIHLSDNRIYLVTVMSLRWEAMANRGIAIHTMSLFDCVVHFNKPIATCMLFIFGCFHKTARASLCRRVLMRRARFNSPVSEWKRRFSTWWIDLCGGGRDTIRFGSPSTKLRLFVRFTEIVNWWILRVFSVSWKLKASTFD